MELIRNRHFKAFIERTYIQMMAKYKSVDESAAKALFEDEYMEDINMLSFVLNSTYSNTKRVDDDYHFVTKDDFVHTIIKAENHKTYSPGAMTLKIVDCQANISFDNPNFHHGQIRTGDDGYTKGAVKCWGGFNPGGFGSMFLKTGLSGALMDMYNFARVSDHDTYMVES